MKIELPKQARSDAITSIRRYFQENMAEPIGNMAAGLLLNYFVEEIGPAIYNQAIADAQVTRSSSVKPMSVTRKLCAIRAGRRRLLRPLWREPRFASSPADQPKTS